MPKNKPHSGTNKRFKMTGSGKVRRQKAGRHIMEKKSNRVKRRLRGTTDVAANDVKKVNKLLGN